MSGDKTDVEAISGQLTALDIKELSPLPDFIQRRIELWDKFKERYLQELAQKPNQPIKVTIKDKEGNVKEVEAVSWKSSPLDLAKQIGSKSWTESLVISKVNGVLWDLERPLEEDCNIELLTFSDDEGIVQFRSVPSEMTDSIDRRSSGVLALFGPYVGRSH